MKALRLLSGLSVAALCMGAASPVLALANRVFVSQRSGNNASSCDNILTPCQTFAGAVAQLNPGGEAIVLDSGGYGPVTITKSLTIEAPPGVTAFIHPPSGDAITVNAAGGTVTLRGLVLNNGSNNGIEVKAVDTLRVESCFITGFANAIHMGVEGNLIVENTGMKSGGPGIYINNPSGTVIASIDHCHMDGNTVGFLASTSSPGESFTTATNTTANRNGIGWICGESGSSGRDVLNLEFCTASGNGIDGLYAGSGNSSTRVRYSNCVFANNGLYGVEQASGGVETRGNNTITGNGVGQTTGTIGTFSPM